MKVRTCALASIAFKLKNATIRLRLGILQATFAYQNMHEIPLSVEMHSLQCYQSVHAFYVDDCVHEDGQSENGSRATFLQQVFPAPPTFCSRWLQNIRARIANLQPANILTQLLRFPQNRCCLIDHHRFRPASPNLCKSVPTPTGGYHEVLPQLRPGVAPKTWQKP